MSDKLKGSDVFDSLTGFDEIAIAQRFGRTVTDLAQHDSTMFTRALIFVARRREGDTDDAAWDAALGLPLKDAGAFFAVDADEADAEDSGKDEPPVPQPETSLSSVS